MATKRRKRTGRARSSRAKSKGELKGQVYMKAVLYTMESVLQYDGEEPSRKMQDAMDEAMQNAFVAGIPHRELHATVLRATKDAQTIAELVESDPDIVIKLTPQGWSVETDD